MGWVEDGILRADSVLKDLVKVIHPEVPSVSNYQTRYLRDVFNNEAITTLTASDCQDPYPICDASVSSYPTTPICERWTYQVCACWFPGQRVMR
jgi:hypothetical protein